jgi:hypothetical protein
MTTHYFKFEEDFVEDNVRCIPMIVRFKLDACLIKLKLSEWSRFSVEERRQLATLPCDTPESIVYYGIYLRKLIQLRTGTDATPLKLFHPAAWAVMQSIPDCVGERLREQQCEISLGQWQALSTLQRFALVKLSSSGHEHKNFSRALAEFNLC